MPRRMRDACLWRSSRAELLAIAVWLVLLSVYYTFVVSAGTFAVTSWNTDYYDMMTGGWRAGHLYLAWRPSPWLLSQSDPYDVASRDGWLWDASLYKGHFYLNWGPVPGLCLAFFKLLRGDNTTVYDQWLVLIFSLVRLYAGTALIVSYARVAAWRVPSWALQLAVLVFALASPTPYFLARPLIYEAAIASGQAFMYIALCLAFWGVFRPRKRACFFVLAGVSLSLAFGSRISLLIATPLICVVTAFAAQRGRNFSARRFMRSLIALGAPCCLALLGYAVYNQLRFDSVAEFGHSYLLTLPRFQTHGYWILPNVVSYLTAELAWSCQFPFVTLPIDRELTTWIRWPDDYNVGDSPVGERVGGVLVATTICWLWFVWFGRAAASGVARLRGRPRQVWSTSQLWLIGCSLALLCAIAPASRMWMANMRFLEDVSGGVVLGAIAAGFWLVTRPGTRLLRAAGAVVFIGLSVHTIVVGACLGFTGHMENFGTQNPDLFAALVENLSLCF